MSRPARVHLVTGASGQDGVLLCRLLAARGERVVALGGPDENAASMMEAYLGPVGSIRSHRFDLRDTDATAALVETVRPDVVHHLAALSSVGRSWSEPEATDEVNHRIAVDLLAMLPPRARFVFASSSEIFGAVDDPTPVGPDQPLAPASPYAEAKAAAHVAVAEARTHRETTNLILFGHTSVLHAPGFALPSTVRAAVDVAQGRAPAVDLENPEIARDWGSAVDVARCFAASADGPPGDYVVGTGLRHRLGDLARWALDAAGGTGAVRATGSSRPIDFAGPVADLATTTRALGWRPEVPLRTTIEQMVRVEFSRRSSGRLHDPAYLG